MADLHLTPDQLIDLLTAEAPEPQLATSRAHVEGCAACREALADLEAVASAAVVAAPPGEPRPELRAAVVAAVREAAAAAAERDDTRAREPRVSSSATAGPSARRLARWLRPRPLLGVAAAAAAVAVAIVVASGPGDDAIDPVVEVQTAFVRPGSGTGVGDLTVTRAGIGRLVAVETSALPELDNDREFYELWFVAPGDRPGAPDRVSAGTFHPDEDGRSSVRLTAAVVPADYPVVSITREPRDGNPRHTGPEVLRSRSS